MEGQIRFRLTFAFPVAIALLLTWSLGAQMRPRRAVSRQPAGPPPVPLGLVPIIWPADNAYTPEKAELGRLLYFDKRLSADGAVSCAFYHSPQLAFTDGAPVSTGIRGQKGGRSAPTVINRAYSSECFQFRSNLHDLSHDQYRGRLHTRCVPADGAEFTENSLLVRPCRF